MSRHNQKRLAAAVITLVLSAGLPRLLLADGPGVYKAKCAACHGADGVGNTPAGKTLGIVPFSAPAVQKLSDAELTTIISDGKGKMPAYGKKLTADEIKSLVTLIRGMK